MQQLGQAGHARRDEHVLISQQLAPHRESLFKVLPCLPGIVLSRVCQPDIVDHQSNIRMFVTQIGP